MQCHHSPTLSLSVSVSLYVCLIFSVSVCVCQSYYIQLKPHLLSTPVIDDVNNDGVIEELLLPVNYYLDDVDVTDDRCVVVCTVKGTFTQRIVPHMSATCMSA